MFINSHLSIMLFNFIFVAHWAAHSYMQLFKLELTKIKYN